MKPVALALSLISAFLLLVSQPADALKYGAGAYGRCQYQTCAITLSTSTAVSAGVVPVGGSTRCTVNSDSLTVTTSSTTGYTLRLSDSDTSTTLTSGSYSIAATTATYASPAVLTAGTWGYRLDNQGNFGAGPTSAITNAAVPTQTYAGVQSSSGNPDTIKTTSAAATSGDSTTIWYGVCIDPSQPSGTYTDGVTYTAIVN